MVTRAYESFITKKRYHQVRNIGKSLVLFTLTSTSHYEKQFIKKPTVYKTGLTESQFFNCKTTRSLRPALVSGLIIKIAVGIWPLREALYVFTSLSFVKIKVSSI